MIYNAGNVVFTKDESDFLISPIGNKISVLDMKNGITNTLPMEARSNIKMIEISPDNRTLVIVDIGISNIWEIFYKNEKIINVLITLLKKE